MQLAVGLACTLCFLALALHGVSLATIGAALVGADPLWIGLAMLVYWGDLALRMWRWQCILRPVAVIPYRVVARALLVGYGFNTLVPARLGELVRAEYLKKTYRLSRVWALTSIVIERLFDGLTVIACLGIGLCLTPIGPDGGILIKVLVSGAVLFGTILLAAIYLSGSTMPRILGRFAGLSAQMAMVRRGLEILRSWRTAEIAATTLLIYMVETFSLWCLVKAVGLRFGPADALVLVGVVSLSTLVPSGPAFLGTLQFAYALAVEFAGGPRAAGVAAATLAQLCMLLPVVVAAAAILAHGSGGKIFSFLARGESYEAPVDK